MHRLDAAWVLALKVAIHLKAILRAGIGTDELLDLLVLVVSVAVVIIIIVGVAVVLDLAIQESA